MTSAIYLIDSDWIADYLKGRQRAIEVLAIIGKEGLAVSLITVGELYEGVYYGANPQSSEAGLRNFLRNVDVLPLNRRIIQRFARLRGDLRAQGQVIAHADVFIAATALHHNRTVVTRNLRHYQRIPGRKLYQL